MIGSLLEFLRYCKAKRIKLGWLLREDASKQLRNKKGNFFDNYRAKNDTATFDQGIFTGEFMGQRFLMHCRLNDEIEGKLLINKLWEPALMQTIASILNRKQGVMMDIGANVGAVTIPLATAHPGKDFYCFEPHPTISNRLRKNIGLNYLSNINVLQQAVSDTNAELTFYAQTESDNMGLSSLIKDSVQTGNQQITVSGTTVDEFVAKNNIAAISLIKIDVQGAELNVLQGMKETLNRLRPVIIFEQEDSLNKTNADETRNKIADMFKSANYDLYAVNTVLMEEFGFAPALDLTKPFEGNVLAIPG